MPSTQPLMLQALKRLFGLDRSALSSTPRYRISSPEQITQLIAQAQDALVLFTATLDDCPEQFRTSLLEIDPEQGLLLLDELSPHEGHELALQRKALSLSGRLNGASLRFKIRIVETVEKSGIAMYKALLPPLVYYHQRRKFTRLIIANQEAPFRAYAGSRLPDPLQGHAYDISPVGIGVLLQQVVALEVGDILSDCRISLPREGSIEFSLNVRVAVVNHERGVTRIGGQLTKLADVDACKIRRFLDRLEQQRTRRTGHG